MANFEDMEGAAEPGPFYVLADQKAASKDTATLNRNGTRDKVLIQLHVDKEVADRLQANSAVDWPVYINTLLRTWLMID